MVKNLKHQSITGVIDEELLTKAQNLAQLEAFSGFLPIRKGTKSPLVSTWGEDAFHQWSPEKIDFYLKEGTK